MVFSARRGLGRHLNSRASAAAWSLVVALALLAAGCGQSAADRRAEAQALLQAGQVEQALPKLEKLAADDPNDAEVQFALGMALLHEGRASEAIFPLSNAANSKEYGVQAGVVLASTLSASGNYEEAIAAADRVLKSHPEAKTALVARANAALQLNRGDLALESADRLLTLQPDSFAYQEMRAAALAKAKRVDEAAALLRKLMETKSADVPGSQLRACVSLAGLYAGLKEKDYSGHKEKAAKQLQVCEERLGDDAPSSSAIMPMVKIYDTIEQTGAAIALLQRAVQRYPDMVKLREALGRRLIAADRFKEAEQLITEDLEEDPSPERWAAVSSVRKAAGNLEGALQAIDQAIALSDPPDQEYLFVRGDLDLALDKVPDAKSVLGQLTEPLYVKTLRARIAQEEGRPKDALDLYDKVLPQWPQNHAIRTFAAQAALDLGDRKRAEEEFLEATRQAPKKTDAAIWLARMKFADGEYGQAIYMAQRQISERGPTAPDAYILAARGYALAGQPKAARAMLKELGQVRDGLFKAEAVAELGRMLAKREGAAKALVTYDKLLAKDRLDLANPANEPALTQLLQLLSDAHQLKAASRRMSRLLAAHPKQPVLHAMKGRVALLREDLKTAEVAFDRALALDPKLPAALAGRALLLRRKGDLEGAAEAMDRAWKLGKHKDYGYMAARIQLALGHVEEARKRFEELLRLHPDDAASANDLAWLLAKQGERLDQAHALAQLALRIAPGVEVLDTLGYVQMKQGDLDAAIGSFRRALDEQPSYGTASYHLALALHQRGRDPEARKSLETALQKTFPESEQARALLTKLEGSGRSVQ